MLQENHPTWPAPDKSLDHLTGRTGAAIRLVGKRALRVADRRKPDLIINDREADGDVPYLIRWWLVRVRWLLQIYLHQFVRSDDARALHDHPYPFNISILLAGEYREHRILAGGVHQILHRHAGDIVIRFGRATHRVELIEGKPCWTLFVAGPAVRDWGFHCPTGWVPWRKFVHKEQGGEGAGCGE